MRLNGEENTWSLWLPSLSQARIKTHLDYFIFGTVLLQKIKASGLHLLGQASHPPSMKITNPNVTCLCWFSQKANRMFHSQCLYPSAAPKQPTAPNGCGPDFGSLPAMKGREGRRCPAATLLSFRKWRGCLAANLSVQISPLCRLYQSAESQCENFLHMNCFARKALLFSEQTRKITT